MRIFSLLKLENVLGPLPTLLILLSFPRCHMLEVTPTTCAPLFSNVDIQLFTRGLRVVVFLFTCGCEILLLNQQLNMLGVGFNNKSGRLPFSCMEIDRFASVFYGNVSCNHNIAVPFVLPFDIHTFKRSVTSMLKSFSFV